MTVGYAGEIGYPVERGYKPEVGDKVSLRETLSSDRIPEAVQDPDGDHEVSRVYHLTGVGPMYTDGSSSTTVEVI